MTGTSRLMRTKFLMFFPLLVLQSPQVVAFGGLGDNSGRYHQQQQSKRNCLFSSFKVATSAAAIALLGTSGFMEPASDLMANAATISDTDTTVVARRLEACADKSSRRVTPLNCVSSNYNEPPNRYLSPLVATTSKDPDEAFQKAIQDLTSMNGNKNSKSTARIVQVSPKERYIRLTTSLERGGGLSNLELVFGDEGVVNLRCEAQVSAPPPPFCVERNCINGSMSQRQEVAKVARILGLVPIDQSQMQTASWTPIFFNTDRVPGFNE